MFVAVPTNGETWLICGGRNFSDACMFGEAMNEIIQLRGCPTRVIHGGAQGADFFAGNWAREMAIECVSVPADWKTHGKAAGPLRNARMLNDYQPKFVVAFPGGKGTADMVRRAREAEIGVAEVKHAKPVVANGQLPMKDEP